MKWQTDKIQLPYLPEGAPEGDWASCGARLVCWRTMSFCNRDVWTLPCFSTCARSADTDEARSASTSVTGRVASESPDAYATRESRRLTRWMGVFSFLRSCFSSCNQVNKPSLRTGRHTTAALQIQNRNLRHLAIIDLLFRTITLFNLG